MSGPDALKARLRVAGDATLIIAHRGVWGPLPENSVAAIGAASDFDIVEIDVQVAADGGLVVHHDETLARMTGDTRALADVAPADLTELMLREGAGGEGAAMSDQKMPDLAQALNAGPSLMFDLDAKNPPETRAVALGAAALGAAARSAVKIDVASSDDVDALLRLETETGLMVAAKVDLAGRGALEVISALAAADVAFAELTFDDLNAVRAAAELAGPDLRLSTYTLDPVHCCGLNDSRALKDPDTVWGTLVDAGIGAIMTDAPDALRAYLNAR